MRFLVSGLLLPMLLVSFAQPAPALAVAKPSGLAAPQPAATAKAKLDTLRARLNGFDLLGTEQVLAAVSEREPVDKALLTSLVHALMNHSFPEEGADAVNWDDVHRLKLKWLHYLVDENISQTSEEYLALAELYSRASNWQETFAHAETGLQRTPTPWQSFGLYLLQTEALLAQKRIGLATQNLDKLKALVPRVYVSGAQVRSSFVEDYRDATIVNMDDKGEYYTRNAGFLAKQDALRELMTTQALKLAPDFAPVHAERSFLLYLDDQHQQALDHISKAIRLDPGNYEYYAKRGDIYRDLNNQAAARKEYLTAISLLEAAQKTRALNPLEDIDLKYIKELRDNLD